MYGHRQNTHYAGSCCEWCDDLARGRAVGNIPPNGIINGQRCADWMCGHPNYCPGRGALTARPSVTTAPVQEYNGFYGADGITLSEHSTRDSRFPGWQESFGAGTYLGNDDFPNDDASHIAIDDGFSATLREHGPSDSRYPGLETTFDGPLDQNLSDVGFRDSVSEITVTEDAPPPPPPTPPVPPTPINGTTGTNGTGTTGTNGTGTTGTTGTNGSSTSTAGVGGDNKTMMYIMGVAIIGLVAWYISKPKTKK